ncbi:disintegrin and metalloproteinase domain-containing protein 33-like [Spea bombifrons]|uniref:disintegrin and metalloproteinase domain-containing protein 33-like n=1 Tax=Spea bombifrons TaxID=233779 RepID=UPI00234B84BA|nr:disintegrin and metalloproteinase domain-containing protein 33-like [Spea bombifrons]
MGGGGSSHTHRGSKWPWIWILLLLPPHPTPGQELGSARGEAVTATWLENGRLRRSVDSTDEMAPPRGEILVTGQKRRLVLEVEKNHLLLSPRYTETHYTSDGQSVTVTPNLTAHCYYHGRVRGQRDSSVALSTCAGISGLIVLNSNDSYYLKPVNASGHPTHALHRTDHLPISGGTCGHESHGKGATDPLGSFLSGSGHHRMKRNVWGAQKYMELFIVADHSLYLRQSRNLGLTKQRILDIANYVDKFYMSVNIKVALIGLEVWTERDQCDVTDDANQTLWNFLLWKQKTKKKHDNAQLLTGVKFRGTTIGMAPLEGMCTPENSGGVSMDHADIAIGAAATMAHEIGHNFGMSHDNDGCCVEATPEQGGCIMAAATGHPFPRKFSSCSQRQLRSYFQKGGGMCLFNMPNTKDLVAGRKCGNGFLEDGEECDCGEPEECTNPCCNANNCTLKAGAQCAHGDCCQGCQLKAAGTLCREMSGACDLPEYCKGDAPYCPPNVYMLDGSPCAYDEAYCYNGMCLTHHQQCVDLWGPGALPAPDSCFIAVNKAGDKYGNCGKRGQDQYVSCRTEDAKCGKIQCQSSAQKPRDRGMVPMDTTIWHNGYEVKCRGTHSYSVQEDDGDSSDPGLVMTGTKCGDGRVCRDGRCQNASFFEYDKCMSQCNGNGVCNSNRNCHCNSGWGPPYCDKPGQGGSVDSGPVTESFHEGLVVFLLLLFLFGIFYWYRQPGSSLKKCLNKSKAKCGLGRATQQKRHRGDAGTVSTLCSFPTPGRSQNGAWGAFQGKAAASQPVNIVRPLRPAPGPVTKPSTESKPLRPPPPNHQPARPPPVSPVIHQKEGTAHGKLLPPKKPLPTCPVKTPQLNPPRKPLPGNPAQKETFLVMTPAANHKPALTNAAVQLKPPHRPKPGGKVQAAAAAFLQKK